MNVTIVQGAFFPVPPLKGGAIEKAWFALGKEFAKLGHDVVHISREFEGLTKEEEIAKVKHRRLPGYDSPRSGLLLKVLDFFYSLRAVRAIPESDIILSNTFWLPILLKFRKRGAVYAHVGRYPKGQMKLYSNAARLQAPSSAIAKAIEEEIGLNSSRVTSIPYPIEIPDSRPVKKEKTILFVGRVHPEKGVELLIKAFVQLDTELQQNWTLKIVGPWEFSAGGGGCDYLSKLKQLASARVEFVGSIFDHQKLQAEYRKASLFAYPSLAEKGETFGLAPLEAMACRTPALVSGLECFQDFIEPNVNGWSFNHREDGFDNLKDCLEKAMMEKEKALREFGERAYKTAQEFSVVRVAQLFLKDFEEVLTQCRRDANRVCRD